MRDDAPSDRDEAAPVAGPAHADAAADLPGFAAAMVEGEPADLPAWFFARMALPVAHDERARFTPVVWWPAGALAEPEGHPVQLRCSQVQHGDHGMTVPFVRCDLSQPFPLRRLLFAADELAGARASIAAPPAASDDDTL